MNKSCAIAIEGLNYSYKSNWAGKPTVALRDITLQIPEGEMFGFLGQSGAGKTTTIKCILNLTHVVSGTIKLFGKSHTDPKARSHLGYVPEQPYFYDHLSVYELMEMYAYLAGVPSGNVTTAIEQALAAVHIEEKIKAPLRSLSKGQTQRVAMAQAIVAKPKLLILDEPFSGLDPLGRKQCKDLLFQLKKEGTTIFVSSHILEDIQNLCDRVSIMKNGEIRKVLSLKELSSYTRDNFEVITVNDKHPGLSKHSEELPGQRTRYHFQNEQEAQQALRVALERGTSIESYQLQRGSLEDLFMEIVDERGA